MRRRYSYDYSYVVAQPRRQYGCFAFLFDVFMTVITSGFWLIWIFIREMRRNS